MSEATGFWNVEWLNQNASRNYPLDDDQDRLDTTGNFMIPNDLLVDMVLPVSPDLYTNPGAFYISSIVVFSQGIVITVSYSGVMIASVAVAAGTHKHNSPYVLVGQGDFKEVVGHVVIGSLDGIMTLSPGVWEFTVDHARLSPSVIRPMLRGVSGLYIEQGGDVSDVIQGRISLVAGQNCRLRAYENNGHTTIYIDFIDGEGSVEKCICDHMPKDAPPIRTINGIPPNNEGNFELAGTSCILLEGLVNGLRFEDVCSEPCCGCDELEVVNSALENLATQINTLDNYANRLDNSMTNLTQNLIASKLSDIPR